MHHHSSVKADTATWLCFGGGAERPAKLAGPPPRRAQPTARGCMSPICSSGNASHQAQKARRACMPVSTLTGWTHTPRASLSRSQRRGRETRSLDVVAPKTAACSATVGYRDGASRCLADLSPSIATCSIRPGTVRSRDLEVEFVESVPSEAHFYAFWDAAGVRSHPRLILPEGDPNLARRLMRRFACGPAYGKTTAVASDQRATVTRPRAHRH